MTLEASLSRLEMTCLRQRELSFFRTRKRSSSASWPSTERLPADC